MASKSKPLTYSEKLRDPRWQKMRLKIMERDNFTCRKCLSTTETLNVHHKEYRPGCDPWEYPPEILITLCEPCHKGEHREKKDIEKSAIPARVKGSDVRGWRADRAYMLLKLASLQEMLRGLVAAGAGELESIEAMVAQMELERDTIPEDPPFCKEKFIEECEKSLRFGRAK